MKRKLDLEGPPRKKLKTTSTYSGHHPGYYLDPPPDVGVDYLRISCEGNDVYIVLGNDFSETVGFGDRSQNENEEGMEEFGINMTEVEELVEKKRIKKAELQEKEESVEKIEIPLLNDGALLIDKYSPRRFVDLLTSDGTNREVLRWIKTWKEVHSKSLSLPVFKRPFSTFKKKTYSQKLLLLTGPPGVGKTTMAHILAKVAGYEAMEINASDDRSRKKLITAINMISQKKSVFFSKKTKKRERPKLIILDEIDGAMGGRSEASAVQQIVLAARTEFSSKKRKGDLTLGTLKVPIICICNDLYAPVLRELRGVSDVVYFAKENKQKIVDRLLYICKKERIPIPRGQLTEMVEFYGNDIRSCLNNLQFYFLNLRAAASKKNKFSLRDYFKDVKKDYRDVLDFIFNPPVTQSRGDRTVRVLFSHLISEVGNERVLSGCFNNYLRMSYADYDFTKTLRILDFLSRSDMIKKVHLKTMDFSLATQASIYPLVVFSLYCRSMYRQPVELALPDYEIRRTLKENHNIVKMMFDGILPSLWSYLSTESLVLDRLPCLGRIIHPKKIRKTVPSLRLLTNDERDAVALLSKRHDVYGSTYVTKRYFDQKTKEHKTTYVLHPDFIKLDKDFGEKKGMYLAYGVKRILSQREKSSFNPSSSTNDFEMKVTRKKNKSKERNMLVRDRLRKMDFRKKKKGFGLPKIDVLHGMYQQTRVPSAVTPSPMFMNPASTFDFYAPHVRFEYKEGASTAVRTRSKISEW